MGRDYDICKCLSLNPETLSEIMQNLPATGITQKSGKCCKMCAARQCSNQNKQMETTISGRSHFFQWKISTI